MRPSLEQGFAPDRARAFDVSVAPAPGAAAGNASGRLVWLDAAKGAGIVLVALGHTMGGLMDVTGSVASPGMQWLFFIIYTFHMPLFFFLSAALVARRIEKSPGRFLSAIATRIAAPYFLWSIVQFTIIYAAGSLVNRPVDAYWPTILALPVAPVSQFWFLYALAVLQLASLVFLTLSPQRGAWLFLAVAIVMRVTVAVAGGPGPLGQAMVFAIYYGAGLLLGVRHTQRIAQLSGRSVALIGLGAVAAIAVACTVALSPALRVDPHPASAFLASLAWTPIAIPSAILGSVAMIGLSMHLPARLENALAYLGQASMPIFLTHVIIIAGTRIVLGRLGIQLDPVVLVPILTFIGISGGILARTIAQRLKIDRLTALQ